MPRVKRSPARPADRPGRLKLLLRRQRRLRRPLAFLAAGLVVVLGADIALRTMIPGASWRERLGMATAGLGLTVRHVVITGRDKTPLPLVEAALGVHRGEPILGISIDSARQRLESIAWIRYATVERELPGTLHVAIVERRPFAVWQHDGHFRLIDRSGNIVTDADITAFAGKVPLVVGSGAPQAAAKLLDALAAEPTIAKRVIAAVRVGERRWNLSTREGTTVMLPEGAVVPALDRLATLQSKLRLLDRPLAVVDMRLPDRLRLRPMPVPPEAKLKTDTAHQHGSATAAGRSPA
ncbi:MAG: cell division protein FtsQ/DivIB [Rhodospirillales bacterium]|nr:cell division protein FtsQ/DivIB [Rhodospirillales bacterium]